MIFQLSYPLLVSSPVYPGTPPLIIEREKSLEQGDSANTSVISLSSHAGTHIDAPFHFCHNGYSVSEILKEKNVFSPSYCLNIEKGTDECITSADIAPFVSQFSDAKTLLIRTGWHRYRSSDPHSYIQNHPWVHPEVPNFIRKYFENIALFGIDTISISSPRFRKDGHTCHRSFLCGDSPLLLLEDVDLSSKLLIANRFALVLYPWVLEKIDGVPVMVFADLKTS